MRGTLIPKTEALSVFCATACMARPVTVLPRKACVTNTSNMAKTKVPMSPAETVTLPVNVFSPPSESVPLPVFATVSGRVHFEHKTRDKKRVRVEPVAAEA